MANVNVSPHTSNISCFCRQLTKVKTAVEFIVFALSCVVGANHFNENVYQTLKINIRNILMAHCFE